MATPLTDTALVTRRNVAVEIGVLHPPPVVNRYIPACVVGIAPPGSRPVGPRRPTCSIRVAAGPLAAGWIEHLRFTPGQDISLLPGLEGPYPSRIRDSVAMLLAAGVEFVDVVMASTPRDPLSPSWPSPRPPPGDPREWLAPWELGETTFLEISDTILGELNGSMILMPDAGGPIAVAPRPAGPMETRLAGLLSTIRAHAERWTERYQVALMDLPDATAEELLSLSERIGSADALICRFEGEPDRLAAHGWRSAAAAVAATTLLNLDDVAMSTIGFPVNIGAGRQIRAHRGERLGAKAPRRQGAQGLPVTRVVLHPRLDTATVAEEVSLRRPSGAWTLPALRTAKAIHYVVRQASEPFVFRPLQGMELYALVSALTLALEPFQVAGVLAGPGGEGGPEISGGIVRDSELPGFNIEITAQLRPWCHQVRMKVTLQQNQDPSVELAT